MQQLLTYINDHTDELFEQWYSLAQRLEAAAHQDTHTLLAEIFSEHTMTLCPLEEYPSLLFAEQSVEASFRLLLLSPRSASPTRTHQWQALATRLLALQLYKEAYGSLPMNIGWVIAVSREHIGSSIEPALHSMQQSHALLQADGCLCDLADASAFPALALGTRGLLRLVLEVNIVSASEHSIYGAILPNAAWRLVWALNTLKDAREDILIDDFYNTLTPPDDDEVALLADAPFIEPAVQRDTHALLTGLQGLQDVQVRFAAQFLPACTIRHISTTTGNEQAAFFDESQQETIPTRAQAYVDFYLIPNQQPEDICAKLRHHLDTYGLQDVHIHVLASAPALHTPLRHSFVQAVRAAAMTARTAKYVDINTLTPIPFATESVFSHPLSSLLARHNIPIIFTQFGPLNTDPRFTSRTQAIQFAHLAHFLALLEELRYATGTTR